MGPQRPTQKLDLNRYRRAVDTALARLARDRAVSRLLSGDPTLWKEGDDHARVIANRLGWLRVAGTMLPRVEEMRGFARHVVDAGTRHVVLLGMGGSSLCPEVLARTFGHQGAPNQMSFMDPETGTSFAFLTNGYPLSGYDYSLQGVNRTINLGNLGNDLVA